MASGDGQLITADGVMLQDYVQWFLIHCKYGYIKNTAYDRYESTYRHHILDSFVGKMKLGQVLRNDIENHLKEKINPRTEEIAPLSRSSVKKILEMFRMAFNRAYDDGLVSINPAANVKLPSETAFVVETKEIECLSFSEINKIRNVIDGRTIKKGRPTYKVGYAIMILLNTGMRCGELLALREKDIDIERGIIRIKPNLIRIKNRNYDGTRSLGNRYEVSTVKTKKSVRVIPINEQCLYYIKKILEYKEENHIVSDFLVCTDNGTHNTPRNVQRSFDSILKHAKVKHYGLHALRHTFGSILIREGIEVSVVSRLLGHSNITITYNRYIHVLEEEKALAIQKMGTINFDTTKSLPTNTFFVGNDCSQNQNKFDPNKIESDPNEKQTFVPCESKKIILFSRIKDSLNHDKQRF